MNIVISTQNYELWLSQQLAKNGLSLDTKALDSKHDEMASAPFPFLRSTFYHWWYRWQTGPKNEWRNAPSVLSVGDLHVENFGTWRDTEGRLIWGINDFDEAFQLPYTNDLVRLATSILLAMRAEDCLHLPFGQVCQQLLAGYYATLKSGKAAASPLVLSDSHQWLLEIANKELNNPDKFWKKLDKQPSVELRDGATEVESEGVPIDCHEAIESRLPTNFQLHHWKRRKAGLGSLGRPRFVALGTWNGGRLAREAKAAIPSAVFWERQAQNTESFVSDILQGAVRCPDPFFAVHGKWLVRRLSPDCDKLELGLIPKKREAEFLYAMGRETANIHLGSSAAIPDVTAHLNALPANWLEIAAHESTRQVTGDWEVWREHHPAPQRN